MKFLMVYTNNYRFQAPPPVGMTFIINALKQSGFEVQALDLMFSASPRAEVENRLESFRPDLVGFSIRNLDNQDMRDPVSILPQVKRYIEQANRRGIHTVIGGTAVTSLPVPMMNYLKPDFGIAGQGESSILQLPDAIASRCPKAKIPGLLWWDNGQLKQNPYAHTGYVDRYPDWSDIKLGNYKKNYYHAAVLTKTGCPYSCTFCNIKILSGRKFIFRPVDNIIADIKRLKAVHNTRYFFFVDHSFNTPRRYATEILERIIRERLNIRLIASVHPVKGSYDDDFMRLFKKAGGSFIMISSESLSDTMLENYGIHFQVKNLVDFSHLAKKYGIPLGIQALFGGPGETPATIRDTICNMKHVRFSLFVFGMGVRILPHTDLYDFVAREGRTFTDEELLFPQFYFSPELDYDRTRRELKAAVAGYRHRFLNLIPFSLRYHLTG